MGLHINLTAFLNGLWLGEWVQLLLSCFHITAKIPASVVEYETNKASNYVLMSSWRKEWFTRWGITCVQNQASPSWKQVWLCTSSGVRCSCMHTYLHVPPQVTSQAISTGTRSNTTHTHHSKNHYTACDLNLVGSRVWDSSMNPKNTRYVWTDGIMESHWKTGKAKGMAETAQSFSVFAQGN